ncbi:MalY/PatB family protein [Chromohalobacter israelensis]|uniref:cysteine-S-conjugate beta-lyase n=1 Tax=Chromohalobacter israelensis (strain ATCC BAA-138 / DSM 3043 / CIP 106854 / NCIMB 13768 / 1H11) TaxID=290398 RepID=Q1QT28_CHRI1|nr:PatB family C-S lyase [Chromohalobacter salexigens]ABE60380.1 aminotransferase, class I and II [Chromohalobacter salexigens DSM 3043]
MHYDFATPLDRRQYPSQKWQRYADDVLPLWVADMDFVSPPEVVSALQSRVAHGVFGYGRVTGALHETLCEWSATHYGWSIEPDWQVWVPGVVPALHLAAQAFCSPGQGVMTATPIYPPFLRVAERSGRVAERVMLAEPEVAGGPWRLDLEALEAAITPQTRLLLWCHPHNPTGRVWDERELQALGELAERHDLLVVSDELHCDLILDPAGKHRPLASLSPALAERTVTLWAPSKTFNIAGLSSACAVIPDPGLRRRFREAAAGLLPDVNVLGMTATQAAYAHGEPWRRELLTTLNANLQCLREHVARWPGVAMSPPEATYLAWLDLRNAGLGASPQRDLLETARVALSDGADFGCPGFARLNFGTPTSLLEQALERLDVRLAADG